MISPDFVKEFALSLDGADEAPHFEHTAYRVKKKIFVTLNRKENRCCVKLNPIDQDVFCKFDAEVIWPVPNAWGKQGWTLISLKKVRKEMLKDAITTAYCTVAPPKMAAKYMEF